MQIIQIHEFFLKTSLLQKELNIFITISWIQTY